MSQAGPENIKNFKFPVNKKRFDPYTPEELESDEFFWSQLELIVRLRDEDYFNHFMRERDKYICEGSGMD